MPSCGGGRAAEWTEASEAQTLQTQVAKGRGSSVPRASALTAAELRLLPLLSTHLSFAEIGAELFLSPNTAKTHAVSIYRRLNAGTRPGDQPGLGTGPAGRLAAGIPSIRR